MIIDPYKLGIKTDGLFPLGADPLKVAEQLENLATALRSQEVILKDVSLRLVAGPAEFTFSELRLGYHEKKL